MRRNSSKRSKVAATFMAILLVATFIALLSPEATVALSSVEIVSCIPGSGPVGETVRVNGTIDTANGSYQILFDGKEMKNGNATGTAVNVTFTIPLSVEGSHNVTLLDVTTRNQSSVAFNVTTSYYVSAEPTWVQEGRNTSITVGVNDAEPAKTYTFTINVTDPQPTPEIYTTTLTVLTDATGSGSNATFYPENFPGANIDYVGTYDIAVIAVNQTFTTGNFTVGLTDRPEYRRQDTVNIRGSGYEADEVVTVDITTAGVSVKDYPKNVTVNTNGVVIDSWFIPANATAGTYTITLTNTTAMGTNKKPADVQNFTVFGAVCQVQAWNLAIPPEPVANVEIAARNATAQGYPLLDWKNTNETGWAEFPVYFGIYFFEARLVVDEDYVVLGRSQNQSFTETKMYRLNLTCWITRMKIAIRDEASYPLPFIKVTINYTYSTRGGENISGRHTFETDTTGIVTIPNALTNISYTIEARRYGHLFNRSLIENLIVTPLINITCPTYTMSVHVLDSKRNPLQNAQVEVYEWSSGVGEPVQSGTTDDLGSAVFHLTFGRYKVWTYNEAHTIILNKTTVDLTEDQWFEINCRISNTDLSVIVKDYFGNPVSNVLVEVEREGVTISPQKTGSNGIASFSNIIGGDCRISVSAMGKVCETRTLYLEKTRVVVFKLERIVVVGGYVLEVTQLIAYVSLGIMVALFALALIYRRLRFRKAHKGEEKEKSL